MGQLESTAFDLFKTLGKTLHSWQEESLRMLVSPCSNRITEGSFAQDEPHPAPCLWLPKPRELWTACDCIIWPFAEIGYDRISLAALFGVVPENGAQGRN